MKYTILAFLAVSSAAAAVKAASPVDPEVIYGDDDRKDLYQIRDPKVLALAGSTVALFEAGDVSLDRGQALLSSSPYGEGMRLCSDEPFYEQGSGAFCSGFLVAPDLVLTAGHCLRSESACRSTKFVFGFGIMDKSIGTPKSVPAGEVYGCKALVGRKEEGRGADWALARLDRAVKKEEHAPLALDRDPSAIAQGTPLFVVGHPAGLPTKVAGGAKVRDGSPNGFFIANLDTYGGNSGSAVFNAKTGLVEGILVRGEIDYETRPGKACRQSKVCPSEGCRGEDVTKISAAIGSLPRPEPEVIFRLSRLGPVPFD
ncbi:MAG: trypsin-like peptidase domain-containing protein [Elusimicrobia bacterium]|nr:trypsin-like peptidase domain-containing protein [Elusimicrobiota bacterium]